MVAVTSHQWTHAGKSEVMTEMQLYRGNKGPTMRGPSDWFTGTVWLDRIIEAPAPARVQAARVAFEPGARTAWHTHPLGQTLHVLFGLGLVQSRGGPVRLIRPGDTVWIPPAEEHWHGASPQASMMHLAIQEADESGTAVVWLEHVTDAEYRTEPVAD
jgi:quercetin dioxygenase-like cupin family protein